MIGREWRASPINYRNSHNPKNFKRTSKVLLKSPRHLFCINSAAEMKPAFKEFVESFKQKYLNPWVLAKLIKNLKAFSFLDKEVFKVSQIGRDDPKRIIYYNDKYFITEKKHWDFSFDNNGISVERQDVIKNNTILKILKEGNIKHLPKVYDYDDGWVVFEYVDGKLLRRNQKPYKEGRDWPEYAIKKPGSHCGYLSPQSAPNDIHPNNRRNHIPIVLGGSQYEMFVATGKAGDIILFDSCGLHSGTRACIQTRRNITFSTVTSCSPKNNFFNLLNECL